MSRPNLNVKVYIDKTLPEIRVIDSTNYTSLGITPSEVFISLELRTPAGLLYTNPNYNTPITTPNLTGVTNSFSFALPLVAGELMKGVYAVKAKLFINSSPTTQVYDYEWSESIDFGCKKISIDHVIDCFCAKFTSTDRTNYAGSNQLTYSHVINYPSETNTADVTTAMLSWSDNKLANGTYVTEVTTKREWIFGPNFLVVAQITGRQDIKVKCQDACEIKCAFNSLWEQYKEKCGKDNVKAQSLLSKINEATALLTLINANSKCGEVQKTDTYMAQLKSLLGDCDCNCDGCDEDDIWVSNVCGSTGGPGNPFDYVFQSCNSLIDVTTTVVGTTKTITVCLSEDTINTLIQSQFTILIQPILNALNKSWFLGLTTACLTGFPTLGTEEQKKQFIIDLLCQLKSAVFTPPVARQDISSTELNTPVENLVTLNDFFTSNVTVSIVTGPINGTCIVLGDGKTLKYTPNTGWDGVDVVTYLITDANGLTSSATWTITVNAAVAVSCATVTPLYNADIYSVGAFLQLSIANQSSVGTNSITALSYIIEIRDNTNAILHSYTTPGVTGINPTIFTTPIPISSTWDNVRIQMALTTQSSTAIPCGTVTFETPTPYSLTDVSISWFDGTTIPVCLGILPTDTEIQKKNKLMNAICAANTITSLNGVTGVGTSGDPARLGSNLDRNTQIEGTSFDMRWNNRRQLFGNLSAPLYGAAYTNNDYYTIAHQQATNNQGSTIVGKNLVLDFSVGNPNVGVGVVGDNSLIVMNFTDSKTISDTSSVSAKYTALRINTPTGVTIDGTTGYPTISAEASFMDFPDNQPGTVKRPYLKSYRPIETRVNSSTVESPGHLFLARIKDGDIGNKITGTTYAINQVGSDDVNRFYGPVQNAGGTLQFTSDERIKDNIQDFKYGLDAIDKIETKTFIWNYGIDRGVKTGVIAQQLEQVIPEAVEKGELELPNGKKFDDFRFVDQNVIFYTMLNAIKELSAKNKSLEQRIAALEPKQKKAK